MISEKLAVFFSNLKKDNSSFFEENWNLILESEDFKENFLSYCLEEKAWKSFNVGIKKELKNIRSIIFANAIRQNQEKILDLIKENNLLDLKSKKASDLFNIALMMNDIIVIDFLKDKVVYTQDVINYALKSKNEIVVKAIISKINAIENFEVFKEENNPFHIATYIYEKNLKEILKLLIEKLKDRTLIKQCDDYLKINDKQMYEKFNKALEQTL